MLYKIVNKKNNVKLLKSEGIDESIIFQNKNRYKNHPRIVFISRPVFDKGLKDFLHFISFLRKKGIFNQTVVYGFNVNEKSSLPLSFFRKAETFNIKFMGYVPNIEKKLYQNDIVLIISEREGANRVLIECLSFKICFLSSDVPGLKDYTPIELRNILLTDFKNLNSSFKKFQFILKNQEYLIQKLNKINKVNGQIFFNNQQIISFYNKKILK